MKLIFIHGRGQEEIDANSLLKIWKTSFKEGLKPNNLTLNSHVDIDLAYYADKLFNATNGNNEELFQIQDFKEKNFYYNLIDELVEDLNIKDDFDTEEKGIYDWKYLNRALNYIEDRFPSWSKVGIKLFTKDVFNYLFNDVTRSKINQIVLSHIPLEECVIVAHSLGSVIAYDVLQKNPQLKIKKLITIGSPLGIKVIKDELGSSISMPSCIIDGWFNAYDKRDVVSLKPLNQNYFYTNPPIFNYSNVQNESDNHHGIEDYLKNPLIAKTIYENLP